MYRPLKEITIVQKEWELVHEERKYIADLQLSVAEEKIKLDERYKMLAEEKVRAINSNREERKIFKDMWDKERKSIDNERDGMREKIVSLNLENDRLIRENESLKVKVQEVLGLEASEDPDETGSVIKDRRERLLKRQDSILSLFFDNTTPREEYQTSSSSSDPNSSPRFALFNPFEEKPTKKGPADVKFLSRKSFVVLFDGKHIRESEYDEKKIIICQRTIRRWLQKKRLSEKNIPLQLLAKRIGIIQELCDSETKYTKELEICVVHYLRPLKRESEASTLIITASEHEILFCNLETILSMSQEFLKGLVLKLSNFSSHDALGNYFVTIIPVMKLYTAYLKNYESSCRLLTELLKREDRIFVQKLEQLETKASSFVTLSDLLAKPVRRLPEYPEYLKRFLEDTKETHSDYESLHEALTKVRQVIQVINEQKREEKNARQVSEVYDRLIGFNKKKSALNPNRRFIREGQWILILSSKRRTGDKNWVFLFDDCIFRTKKVKEGLYRFIEKIELFDVSINFLEEPGASTQDGEQGFWHNALVIKSKKSKEMFILGKTLEQKESWRKTIEELITAPKPQKNKKATAVTEEQTKPESLTSETKSGSSILSSSGSVIKDSPIKRKPRKSGSAISERLESKTSRKTTEDIESPVKSREGSSLWRKSLGRVSSQNFVREAIMKEK